MMRWIGIISLIVILAKFPEQVKAGVDIGSWVAKVVWILSEKTVKAMGSFYDTEVAAQVEAAKKVDVSKP